jgi:hypothetical protein
MTQLKDYYERWNERHVERNIGDLLYYAIIHMRLTKCRQNLGQYLLHLRFSQRWPWRVSFSGMLRCVIWFKPNVVSDGYIATTFRQQGESYLLPASCCFHLFRPWKRRRYVSPNSSGRELSAVGLRVETRDLKNTQESVLYTQVTRAVSKLVLRAALRSLLNFCFLHLIHNITMFRMWLCGLWHRKVCKFIVTVLRNTLLPSWTLKMEAVFLLWIILRQCKYLVYTGLNCRMSDE